MTKVGGGTVELGDASNNNYTGGTVINDGKLLLNKTDPGANYQFKPYATGTAGVTVGNEGEFAGSRPTLQWGADANNQQIWNGFAGPNGAANSIAATSSGLVDLATNNKSNFIYGMSMETGRNYSSIVQTGTGSTSFLTLDSDITINPNVGGFGVTDGASPAASITGNITLTGALDSLSTQQQFIVNPTFVPTENSVLNVSATVNELTPTAATDGSVGLYLPGLREVTINAADAIAAAGTFGTAQLFPRSGEVFSNPNGANQGYNPSNTTFAYEGQFYLPVATQVSFAGSQDDYTSLSVDGTLYDHVQLGGGFSSTISLNSGWHNLDLRVSNAGGPGGANGVLGLNANFGAGWAPFGNTNSTIPGSGMIIPIDNGSGTVFRSAAGTNDAALNKNGLGTVVFSGAVNTTGPTLVNQGELILNGQGKVAGIENAVQQLNFNAPTFGATTTTQTNINTVQACADNDHDWRHFHPHLQRPNDRCHHLCRAHGVDQFRSGLQSDCRQCPGGTSGPSGHRKR